MRFETISPTRRAVVAATLLAVAPSMRPLPGFATPTGTQDVEPLMQACRSAECEERRARTSKEVADADSPLVQELLKRTKENKAKNEAITKAMTQGAQAGVYDEEASAQFVKGTINVKGKGKQEVSGARNVRYRGETKSVTTREMRELAKEGYELECPSVAALPCELKEVAVAPAAKREVAKEAPVEKAPEPSVVAAVEAPPPPPPPPPPPAPKPPPAEVASSSRSVMYKGVVKELSAEQIGAIEAKGYKLVCPRKRDEPCTIEQQ